MADGETKRKPNPNCQNAGCNHPLSFHSRRDPKTHRRRCGAFGCKCSAFKHAPTAKET